MTLSETDSDVTMPAPKDPTAAASKKRSRDDTSPDVAAADNAQSNHANTDVATDATAADEGGDLKDHAVDDAADDDAETEEEEKEVKRARIAPPAQQEESEPPLPLPTSAASESVATVETGDEKAGKPDAPEPALNLKKRKTPAAKKSKKEQGDASSAAPVDAEGEETESEPEKQPKKRVKAPDTMPTTSASATAATPAGKEKKSVVRKKKKPVKEAAVVPSSDSEDEQQQLEVERRVEALDPDVKAKFGTIVWAKMSSFPYWPALITDPRHLPPPLQANAAKDLETKYLVYYYSTKNFAPTTFKNIALWEDTKNDYRSGFPPKESKAPKRRAQLMEAIAEADKDLLLPIDERGNGLLKPFVKVPKVKKQAVAPAEGSGGKRKQLAPLTARRTSEKSPKATERKPKVKKSVEKVDDAAAVDSEATVDERSQESHEDEDDDEEASPAARTLSKDEIKAKIASRKTPSKKKVPGDDADAKTKAGSGAKKAAHAGGVAKSSGKALGASEEIDTKRKKEIELMVPRKSVKSADIREMTEEAAKKKLPGDKTKKDKGAYRVGDLATFASKLRRLHETESATNSDEVIRMLAQLFEEKLVYRSDVERSGLASIIAVLRKSANMTVAHTASAVRKHMIDIIQHDTSVVGSDKSAGKAGDGKAKKPKGDAKVLEPNADTASATAAVLSDAASVKPDGTDAKDESSGSSPASGDKVPTAEPLESATTATGANESSPTPSAKDNAPSEAKNDGSASATPATEQPALNEADENANGSQLETPADDAASKAAERSEALPSPPSVESRDDNSGAEKADASLDTHRLAFVEMLRGVLDPSGAAHLALAKEIEEFVFDRYKESNDDYRAQARKITFGLKKNANLRERLIAGALHGLELVYADDKFFEA